MYKFCYIFVVAWEKVRYFTGHVLFNKIIYVVEAVSYKLHNSDTDLDSVISFESHHALHKRQTSQDSTSTENPVAPPTTTPQYTEQEVGLNHHKSNER
jgi:hypothetical protein